MSTTSANKTTVGRQAQLPLGRAFKISMNSLRIRFWRSMVTAGGIFLGIAFLATVLTQWLMQWPVAPKVDAGFIRLDGQINGPGDYDVYKPVPVEAGVQAGIPEEVIKRVLLKDANNFSLTEIIQGQLQEKRAVRNLARVKKEWQSLSKYEKDLPLYVDILGGKDIKIGDAVKAGVPKAIVAKAVALGETIEWARLFKELQRTGKPDSITLATALNKDITPAQAISAGIPKDLVDAVMAVPREIEDEEDSEDSGPPPPKPGAFRGTLLAKVLDENPDFWTEFRYVNNLRKVLPVYADMAAEKDIRVEEAVKAGLPGKVAEKMASQYPTFKGADLIDIFREQTDGIKPIYLATALDQDITIKDAVRADIPIAIAKKLAGSGKAFKGSSLNDLIKDHPRWIKIWTARVSRNAIFDTAPQAAIDKLAKSYSISLKEALDEGKGPDAKSANLGNLMIVNADGRKVKVNLNREPALAAATPLVSGDYVFIPDINSFYRMWWLVGMSLLVCMVGITNSMLMAVTERFKEIGTMKCLGALDSFVVLLLVLESSLLGICASGLGWLLGFVSMVLLAGFTKGWDVVATMNPWLVLGSLGVCVVAGMVLTLVATILPAMQAARMPAAMALRSEI